MYSVSYLMANLESLLGKPLTSGGRWFRVTGQFTSMPFRINVTTYANKDELLGITAKIPTQAWTNCDPNAWFPADAVVPTPAYPVTVRRGPYSFTADNAVEEKQLKDFLGIDPPGDDLDTYIGKLDAAGLASWANYWLDVWSEPKHRNLYDFVKSKALAAPPKLTQQNIDNLKKAGQLGIITPSQENYFYERDMKGTLTERDIAEVGRIEGALQAKALKVLPAPDPRLHDEGLRLYYELDAALAAKNNLKVMSVLRQMLRTPQSPIAAAILLLANPYVISVIVGAVGSVTFSKFLYEEALQQASFSTYSATSMKQWDLAQRALDEERMLLDRSLLDQIIEWIPAVNLINAVTVYWGAADRKWKISAELVARKQKSAQMNPSSSIENTADSIATGADPAKYLPDYNVTAPKPEFKIRIESSPSNAKIYIDNVYTRHLTPSDEKELKDVISLLAVGRHTIKVTKAGMQAEQEVDIVEGDNGRIFLTLGVPGLPAPKKTTEEIQAEIDKLLKQIEELRKLLVG